MEKIKNAAFEAAAHTFAVWLSVAGWIERHKHWALTIWIATLLAVFVL